MFHREVPGPLWTQSFALLGMVNGTIHDDRFRGQSNGSLKVACEVPNFHLPHLLAFIAAQREVSILRYYAPATDALASIVDPRIDHPCTDDS